MNSGNNEVKKNWRDTERKEEKCSNAKTEGLVKVDLQHPVFNQKMLEELRERREETPPMEISLDHLNGMQRQIQILVLVTLSYSFDFFDA